MDETTAIPKSAPHGVDTPDEQVQVKLKDTSTAESRDKSGFKSYLRVFTYNDGLGWGMNVVAFMAAVAAGSTLPLMDIVFGRFVTVFNNFATGTLSPEAYRQEVSKYTLWFIYLFVAKFALVYTWTVLFSITATRTTKSLRITYLQQMLRQEVAYFDSAEAGSISGQITTNANLVNQGISEKLGLSIQAASTFVSAFIVAFTVQAKLTAIIIGIVPAILIVTLVCISIDIKNEAMLQGIFARAGLLAEDVFSSIRTVHAFWAFSKLSANYETILEEARKVGLRKGPNYAVLFSFEFFAIYAGYGLAFWQGLRMYGRGDIADPGVIVTVIFAVVVAAQSLTAIAPQLIQLSKASAAAAQLFRTIDRPSRIDALSPAGHAPPAPCTGALAFHNVTFAYPSRPALPVLRNFSLALPAARTTAVVGASGSGKSTLVALLERWFDPDAGVVTLDGVDLRECNPRWLRTQVRLVQQEPTLFSGSVRDNVANGLPAGLPQEEVDARVEAACRDAGAHGFVEQLPQGYDTPMGARGAALSGGQRQRLAIARAVVGEPRVLLLDEATSALDPAAEAVVQRALDNVKGNRTVVVIAHRLSTVRKADNIVVMSEGVIVEQGTHEALLEADGAYARLVRAQDLGQGEGNGEGEGEKGGTVEEVRDGEELQMAKTTSRRQPLGEGSGDDVCQEKCARTMGLLRCIANVAREQRSLYGAFAVVAFSCILAGATYPGLALVFSRTMSVLVLPVEQMTSRGDFYSPMFLVIALGNILAFGLLGWFMTVVSQTVITSYQGELFRNLLRQDMTFFDAPENSTGAIASRLSSEPVHLQELISFNIALIAINIVNVVSSCILAIAYGWKLGLVLALGALPPLVLSGYVRIRLEFKLDEDKAARFADAAGIATEAVLAIRTVASLTLERQMVEKVKTSLEHIATKAIKSLVWTMLWYALSQSISFLAMALGFWYGGQLMSTGEYDTIQFYIVFISIIFSGEAAAMFFQYTTSFTKAQTAFNYIFKVRAQVPPAMLDEDDGIDDEPNEKGGVAVECQELCFAYPQRPDTKVLREVSASIQPGQFVAFVGASSCGKTTMINLLERFYTPTSGTLLLGTTPAASIPLPRYRSALALVQQEPFLYQGTIRDNILLGTRPSPRPPSRLETDDAVLTACHAANIATFIASLPDGLSTPCGAQGLQLSGGQRQRIAIARALMRQPRLLLLDEATSSLDSEAERSVQAALDAAARGGGRTTVAVAHRLSTVKGADVIFVFARGRVVERGTHEELVGRRGVYYEMCLGQSLDRAV